MYQSLEVESEFSWAGVHDEEQVYRCRFPSHDCARRGGDVEFGVSGRSGSCANGAYDPGYDSRGSNGFGTGYRQ